MLHELFLNLFISFFINNKPKFILASLYNLMNFRKFTKFFNESFYFNKINIILLLFNSIAMIFITITIN